MSTHGYLTFILRGDCRFYANVTDKIGSVTLGSDGMQRYVIQSTDTGLLRKLAITLMHAADMADDLAGVAADHEPHLAMAREATA